MYICFSIFFYTYVYIFLIYTIYFNTRVYLYVTLLKGTFAYHIVRKNGFEIWLLSIIQGDFYRGKSIEHLIFFRKWSRSIFQFSKYGYNLQRDLIHFYKHWLVLRIINACTLSTWLVFRSSFTHNNLRQNCYKYHDQCISIMQSQILNFWQSKNIIYYLILYIYIFFCKNFTFLTTILQHLFTYRNIRSFLYFDYFSCKKRQ